MPILIVLMGALGAAPAWVVREERESFRLETRAVEGSAHEEIRITAQTEAELSALCDAIWGGDTRVLERGFRKREVLKESPDERWIYEQIATPVVSDRDYTLHQRRLRSDVTCEVHFQTENHLGPPPAKGLVRIPVIRGQWTVSATPQGSTVVYVVYSEPGGSVPAFLTRGPTRTSALEWMKRILERARLYAQRK